MLIFAPEFTEQIAIGAVQLCAVECSIGGVTRGAAGRCDDDDRIKER